MKNLLKSMVLLVLLTTFSGVLKAQVGIGTTNPSHALTLVANSDPLRILGLNHNASVDTLMVIASNGVVYKRALSTITNTLWSTVGNAGTSASTNFIGTTDSVDFVIRVQNTAVGRFIAGKKSFRGGTSNQVTGTNTFVFGYGDTVASDYSFAGGYTNKINTGASYSGAFGAYNTIKGSFGYSTGERNLVEGIHGSAYGEQLIVNSYNLAAFGSYNDTVVGNRNWVDSANHIFVVGNGHLLCDRSNVITATWGGNVGIDNKDPKTALDVHGGFALRPRTTLTKGTITDVTSNNFAYTVDNRSYLRVNSTGSPSSRSMVLSDGLQVGQILIIECIATGGLNGVRLVDNAGTHNTNLAAGTIDLYESDIVGLIWNGTDWIQLFNSNN